MKDRNGFTSINDFLHAVVLCGVLVVPALGLSDELFSFRGADALAIVASAVTGASVAYGATLSQP
jgi:hypothetical protein